MAIKYTSAEIAKNSVKVKPRTSPPTPKTPAAKPTMAAKKPVKAMSADAARKANTRGLKAANQNPPKTKAQIEAGRAAVKRALLTPPAKRTAAQNRAMKSPSGLAVRFGGGGMNWQNK